MKHQETSSTTGTIDTTTHNKSNHQTRPIIHVPRKPTDSFIHSTERKEIQTMGKEEEFTYSTTAVPAPGYDKTDQDVPANHQRFFCEKCQLSYDLPNGATSWRCSNCHTFNSTAPPECPCCVIQ